MEASLIHGSWWPYVEPSLFLFQDQTLDGYRTLITSGSPLRIGISDMGWALEGNSFLAPARELDLLYRAKGLAPALRAQRRRLGYVYLPLWILNQKEGNRFQLSRLNLRQLLELLSSVPRIMRFIILIVALLPGWLVRTLAFGARRLRLVLRVGS